MLKHSIPKNHILYQQYESGPDVGCVGNKNLEAKNEPQKNFHIFKTRQSLAVFGRRVGFDESAKDDVDGGKIIDANATQSGRHQIMHRK